LNFVIVIVVLVALMWFLLIRPQRKRSQTQMSMQDTLRVGDEIITAGGLHATIRSIEDDVLEIELARDTVARLDRRAVAAVVHQDEEEDLEPETVAEESAPADES
jgi:preprotein translocase subunit YajC